MKELKGIPASPGIARAPAFLFIDEEPGIPNYAIAREQVAAEWDRFVLAINLATKEVTELRDKAKAEMGQEQGMIFDAHILMLNDPDFHGQIEDRLGASLMNIEFIIHQIEHEIAGKLAASEDEYLRERSADIHDVSKRVLGHLLRTERTSLRCMERDSILVARDILPSEAMSMDRARVKGIVTDAGGKTSHMAILARAFEIPAVLGLGDFARTLKGSEQILIDGDAGTIIVDPDPETARRYDRARKELGRKEAKLHALAALPATTTDGTVVKLEANIEIPEETGSALAHGADGIGLYRSEFLFFGREGPAATEDEQEEAYRRVLEGMGGKPVTIRTLDLGGDKMNEEMEAAGEKNPLLGWRAIRYCLSRREFFKAQLRALLRASTAGSLRIMFPMISGIEEFEAALEVLDEAREELAARGIPFVADIPVGCMIEIPSAAMTCDILAERADFFSIGTNDLIQYSLAVDRGNEKTAYLYQPFHPGVMRLVKRVIDAAHEAGIQACMCGELAGLPAAAPVLLGLGLDEFSMSSPGIPQVKRIVRSTGMAEARALAEELLGMKRYRDVEERAEAWLAERLGPEGR